MSASQLFLGVRSSVICLDADTGATMWQQELGAGFGEGFVSLALDAKRVFAHTRGKVFCLDRPTGTVLWKNDLPGTGYGLAFVCTDSSPMHYVETTLKKEQMRSSGG